MRRLPCVVVLGFLLVAPGAAYTEDAEENYRWDGVENLVAVGDVHGAYDPLVGLLRGLGLVDQGLHWSGASAHLVFVGDLIDRGPGDRAILDLTRRLQREAEAAGGRVHVLLGNHEAMNLVGDLRYVSAESFAAFEHEETDRERRAGWSRYRGQYDGPELVARRAFDEQRPPGYFARERLLAPDGEYGAWLLERPAVVVVNGIVFVHGGLTEELAAAGLVAINRNVREGVRGELKRKAAAMFDPYAPDGPLWYRGLAVENERILRVPLERILEKLGARAMVIAHTPTETWTVTSRFNGRLYRTDVGMGYGKPAQALVFDDDEAWVFDPATFLRSRPVLEAPQGQGAAAFGEELPNEQIEEFLGRAKPTHVVDVKRGERHLQLVDLERKGLHVRVIFQFVDEGAASAERPNPRRYQHEVAAYRLDRMFDLGMVPVAVERKIKGQSGAASYWLRSAIDLPYISEYGRHDLLRGIEDEIAIARTFTALIGARDRHGAAKMLVPSERRIILADNSRAFPLDTKVEDLLILEAQGIRIDACDMRATFEMPLLDLDRKELEGELGDYLSGEQITALLARRDGILESCAGRDAIEE
jgi:hypothetical protein